MKKILSNIVVNIFIAMLIVAFGVSIYLSFDSGSTDTNFSKPEIGGEIKSMESFFLGSAIGRLRRIEMMNGDVCYALSSNSLQCNFLGQ